MISFFFSLYLNLIDIPDPTIKSKEELRFTECYEQERVNSCGITTVLTLVNNFWGLNYTEDKLYEIYSEYIRRPGKVPREGAVLETDRGTDRQYLAGPMSIDQGTASESSITLRELSVLLDFLGFSAAGYYVTKEDLLSIIGPYAPIIVLYEKPYPHYALIVGKSHRLFVALDPVRGFELVSPWELKQRRQRVVLLVCPKPTSDYIRNEAKISFLRLKAGRLIDACIEFMRQDSIVHRNIKTLIKKEERK